MTRKSVIIIGTISLILIVSLCFAIKGPVAREVPAPVSPSTSETRAGNSTTTLDFTLVNWTGALITAVYVSPSQSSGWEENLLAGTEFDEGDTVNIRFNPNERATLWDIRVEGRDGHYSEWKNLDLRTVSRITLRLNMMSQPVAVAELE